MEKFVRYRREIKYESSVYADYAAKRCSPANNARFRNTLFVYAISLSILCLLGQPFFFREPVNAKQGSAKSFPAERIGLRLSRRDNGGSIGGLLSRLPFEPRLPEVEDTTPQILPESALARVGWQTTPIKPGDNLSIIFERLGLSKQDLVNVLSSEQARVVLKRLHSGRTLAYRTTGDSLQELAYPVDHSSTLLAKRVGDHFSTELAKLAVETKLAAATGQISRSLFLDGQAAGLSDRTIIEFTNIFGWDVDFVREIRRGDRFKVIYEEFYRNGEKIRNGRILGAEFTHQGRRLRAIYYKASDGTDGYFSDKGQAMRKAFLRTPLNFTRISSRFNLARLHPLLNRIRAHKGVDYAAPMGTPIHAVANGKIEFLGQQHGYGNVVILQHGDSYSTLYGHMSKFAKNIGRGGTVAQGQLIGYVGKSGLATGPHLHYEFRINGVHHDPLTVKLPHSLSIDKVLLADFRSQTKETLAMLDALRDGKEESREMVANASKDESSLR